MSIYETDVNFHILTFIMQQALKTAWDCPAQISFKNTLKIYAPKLVHVLVSL